MPNTYFIDLISAIILYNWAVVSLLSRMFQELSRLNM